MLNAVNKPRKQHYSRSISYDKDQKRIELFGRKAYSSETLQFWITNYKAVMAKYDFTRITASLQPLLNIFHKSIESTFRLSLRRGSY